MGKYKVDYNSQEVIDLTWELIQKARKGDRRASQKIVNLYSDYVEYMVGRYSKKTNIKEDDDLRSTIHLGLLEGINKYDPEKGTKFIYFTHNWMKKLIFSESNKYYRFIRLPVNQSNFESSFKKKYPNLDDPSFFDEDDSHATHDPDYLKYRLINNTEAESFTNRQVEFNNHALFIDENFTENDLIDYESERDVETIEKIKLNINKVLIKFDVRERETIEYLFGLNGRAAISTEKLSSDLNISKVSVIFIRNKVIRMMRHSIFKNMLLDEL